METELYLKYVGIVQEDDSEIPLADLGQSLIGFEKLVQEFAGILRLEGDISVTAVPSREGSHIVNMILHFEPSLTALPFDSPETLLEFLKLTGQQYSRETFEFIQDQRDFLNKYFSENPFDVAFLSYVIVKLITWSKKIKKMPEVTNDELPRRIVAGIIKILKMNRYKSFISPIINDTALSIEVSQNRDFKRNSTKIDQMNFEDLLTENDQILPDLIDGDEKTLKGVITSLKGTRGDSFTFKTSIDKEIYTLELFPPPPRTTKNYINYYQENVEIDSKVERNSMFKKPKLHLIDINLMQESLPFIEESD